MGQKLLLGCNKVGPYLYKTPKTMVEKYFGNYHTQLNKAVLNDNCLNGKIVAECDFEIEEIKLKTNSYEAWFETKTLNEEQLREKSCLRVDELYNYLKPNDTGYAMHIKNLHIFDEPREVGVYSRRLYLKAISCNGRNVNTRKLYPI